MHSQALLSLHPEFKESPPDTTESYTGVSSAPVFDDSEHIAILNDSCSPEFLLSVSFEDGGLPRIFIGATSQQQYVCYKCSANNCSHCKGLESWLNEQEEAVFEGLAFRASGSGAGPIATGSLRLPISDGRIDPALASPVILRRSLGALGGSCVSQCVAVI